MRLERMAATCDSGMRATIDGTPLFMYIPSKKYALITFERSGVPRENLGLEPGADDSEDAASFVFGTWSGTIDEHFDRLSDDVCLEDLSVTDARAFYDVKHQESLWRRPSFSYIIHASISLLRVVLGAPIHRLVTRAQAPQARTAASPKGEFLFQKSLSNTIFCVATGNALLPVGYNL